MCCSDFKCLTTAVRSSESDILITPMCNIQCTTRTLYCPGSRDVIKGLRRTWKCWHDGNLSKPGAMSCLQSGSRVAVRYMPDASGVLHHCGHSKRVFDLVAHFCSCQGHLRAWLPHAFSVHRGTKCCCAESFVCRVDWTRSALYMGPLSQVEGFVGAERARALLDVPVLCWWCVCTTALLRDWLIWLLAAVHVRFADWATNWSIGINLRARRLWFYIVAEPIFKLTSNFRWIEVVSVSDKGGLLSGSLGMMFRSSSHT